MKKEKEYAAKNQQERIATFTSPHAATKPSSRVTRPASPLKNKVNPPVEKPEQLPDALPGENQALRESEEQYRLIVESLTQGVVIHQDNQLVYANPAALRLMGAARWEDIVGKAVIDFVHPDDRPLILSLIQSAFSRFPQAAISVPLGEERLIRLDGAITTIEASAVVVNFDGKPALMVMMSDITARKQMEKALRFSEGKYRKLHESMMDGFVLVDLQGKIIDSNPTYQKMTGYTPEELLQLSYQNLTPEKWYDFEQKIVDEQILRQGYSEVYEKEYRRKDGLVFPIELRAFLIKNENGEKEGMWAIVRDITRRKRAEQAITAGYSTLRGIIDSSSALIFSVDRKYRYTSFNQGHAAVMKAIYGQDIDIGGCLLDYMVVADDRRKAQAHINRALAGERLVEESFSGEAGRSRLYFEVTHTPIKTEGGEVIGVAIFSEDITRRKQTLEALRESEARFRGAFEQSSTGMCMITPSGVFLRVNAALCHLLGYAEQELTGSSIDKFTHPEDINLSGGTLQQALLDRHMPIQFEKRYIHKEGKIIRAFLTSSLVFNEGDEPLYFISQVQDITERKQAEDTLENERNLLRTLIDNIPDPVYFKDKDSRFIRINHAMFSHNGIASTTQVLGKTDFNFFSEQHAQAAFEDEQRIIRTGEPLIGIEEEEIWPNGRSGWVSTTKMALRDKEGQIIGTFGISRDITERKLVEFSLQQRLSELELVNKLSISLRAGDNVRELVSILLDETLKAVHIGDGGIFLYDEAHDALILTATRGWLDVLHNLAVKPSEGIAGDVFTSGKTVTSIEIYYDPRGLKRIHDLVPPHWGGVFLPVECNAGILGVLMLSVELPRVITGNEMRLLTIISQLAGNALYRARLHEQLKLSNETLQNEVDQHAEVQKLLAAEKELLSTTLMGLGEGVIVTDKNGLITLFNHSAERITGFTSAESVEKSIHFIFKLCDSNTQEVYQNVIFALFELDYAQKTGSHYHAPTLITRSGERILVAGSISALKSARGDVFGFVLVFQDVTEKQKLESQTALSQKMEAIGQLAAGIAHEINTPIQYIGDNLKFLGKAFSRYLEMLDIYQQAMLEHIEKPFTAEDMAHMEGLRDKNKITHYSEEIPKAVEESLEGTERVRKIVLAMREFSHPSEKEKKTADINHGIETTIAISRNEWKYCADMEVDLDPNLPLVHCQIDEINQVVLNMIVNAAQAIQEKTPAGSDHKEIIAISTRLVEDRALIIIRDSGPGIAEAVRARIFDPFFTTKGVGKGTGQGLSLAHNIIVNKHHGKINVDSELGHGTTFTIELPVDGGE